MDSQFSSTLPVQDRIIASTCQHFNISIDELKKPCRLNTEKERTYQRRIASFLMREHTILSYSQISSRLNFKCKNTVRLGVEEIRVQKNIYNQIRHDIKVIESNALL